ncbi:MAG TPA: HNH endonuclease family protein [Acidimicrobiales bacterium]|nr:HNH endonuclease family protein [Acidimicrobiales bacterium]
MSHKRRLRWIVVLVVVAVLALVGTLTDSGEDENTATPPAGTAFATTTAPLPTTGASSTRRDDTQAAAAGPAPTASAVPATTTTPPAGPVATTRWILGGVPIKGRAPKTGYERSEFGPAWTDDVAVPGGHNGCDTRNDILRRDLTATSTRPGTRNCVVLTGVLADPYTGKRIDFTRGQTTSSAVQIDHVVALNDAWQKGAQQLSTDRRRMLANDPLNLLAVDGPANNQKGAGDAATWLPHNKGFRCRYVALQTNVKARYDLWMTRAEHDAISRILSGCSDAQVGAIG